MKNIDYKLMGARIRKQRELSGYTREQIAEKLDVSAKFCSDIELGIKGMSLQTLTKLCNILDMSSDYILYGDTENPDTDTAISLVQKCPDEYKTNLNTIIRAFINSVSDN